MKEITRESISAMQIDKTEWKGREGREGNSVGCLSPRCLRDTGVIAEMFMAGSTATASFVSGRVEAIRTHGPLPF